MNKEIGCVWMNYGAVAHPSKQAHQDAPQCTPKHQGVIRCPVLPGFTPVA